jgi:flavodoxin
VTLSGGMNRRAVLRHSAAIAAGALSGMSLAGCNSPTPPAAREPSTSVNEPSAAPSGPRVLLVFFSRAGENYYYGGRIDLEVGNTEVAADMMSSSVDVEVYRIEAADPYPQAYEETVARNSREQDEDARPAIAGALPSVAEFDTVVIGSPIWGSQIPMIMRTFCESVDLSGKQVFPFVTYAVSGLGNTVEEYTELCPGATIGEGLAIQGEEVRDAGPEVDAWLKTIGLLPGQ